MYELIKSMLLNIFASRVKNISDKFLEVWVREIGSREFSSQAIMEAEREIMDDDSIPLTIASVCKVIKQFNNRTKGNDLEQHKNCPYCKGTGIASFTLKFDNSNKFVSDNYALKCHHYNGGDRDLLKMVLDPSTHNKTYADDGFYFVFANEIEKTNFVNSLMRGKREKVNA